MVNDWVWQARDLIDRPANIWLYDGANFFTFSKDMPITSSAKKAMRQAKTRLEQRKPYKTRLKTEIKKMLGLVKTDSAQAQKSLPEIYSVIDTAAKKHIIHKNNAARKKSRLAILVDKSIKGELKAATPAKKAAKAKAKTKKK